MRKGVATSFSLPPDFKDYLGKLAAESGKTKTRYVMDAVTLYAKDVPPESKLLDQMEALASNQIKFAGVLDEIRTLCIQLLKDRQEG